MAVRWCERLFNPDVLAVVGAGQRPGSMGSRYLANLRSFGFSGRSYAVSPNPQLDGFVSIDDVPEPIDLCLVAAPFEVVPEVVASCARNGVGVVQVLTAPDGSRSSDEVDAWSGAIVEALDGGETRLIGPNCVGLHVPSARITFLPDVGTQEGRVSFVSQSGGLTADFIAQANAWGVGLRNVVSVGNCLDVDVWELIDFLADDEHTGAIGVYIEGTRSGSRLLSSISAAAKRKPIFILKGGRSRLGARAAATHTGSLAGEYRTWRDLLEGEGGTLVATPDELLFALSAASDPSGAFHSSEAALVGNGGGMTVLMSDALEDAGFGLVDLSAESQSAIEQLSPPPGAFFGRATDVPGGALSRDPDALGDLIDVLVSDPSLGGVFAHFNLIALAAYDNREEIVDGLVAALRKARARIPVHLGLRSTGDSRVEGVRKALVEAAGAAGIPSYPSGIQAIVSAGAARQAQVRRDATIAVEDSTHGSVNVVWDRVQWRPSRGVDVAPPADVERVVDAVGLVRAQSKRAHSIAEALGVAAEIGFPVVAKLEAPNLIHKTESGAVRVGIGSPRELEAACTDWQLEARIAEGSVEALLVQEQIPAGVEVLVGARHDATFGPVVLLGVGGTLTELIDQVSTVVAPTSPERVRRALGQSRLRSLLDGYRGAKPADVESLADLVVRFSLLAASLPEGVEVECNPVIAGPTGSTAVDIRIVRESGGGSEGDSTATRQINERERSL